MKRDKICKRPECNEIIKGKRADAVYCSEECLYTHRNQIYKIGNEIYRIHKKLEDLLLKGIKSMHINELKEYGIDVDESNRNTYSYSENGLFEYYLLDICIRIKDKEVQLVKR